MKRYREVFDRCFDGMFPVVDFLDSDIRHLLQRLPSYDLWPVPLRFALCSVGRLLRFPAQIIAFLLLLVSLVVFFVFGLPLFIVEAYDKFSKDETQRLGDERRPD